MEQKALERRRLQYVPISNLRFDPRNPRLPSEAMDYSQTQLLDILERDFDVLPIAQSMVDNGYFDEERARIPSMDRRKM